jgi:hypothetical protein
MMNSQERLEASLVKNLDNLVVLIDQLDLVLAKIAAGMRPNRRQVQQLRTKLAEIKFACATRFAQLTVSDRT